MLAQHGLLIDMTSITLLFCWISDKFSVLAAVQGGGGGGGGGVLEHPKHAPGYATHLHASEVQVQTARAKSSTRVQWRLAFLKPLALYDRETLQVIRTSIIHYTYLYDHTSLSEEYLPAQKQNTRF